MSATQHPPGYWSDFSRVEAELRAFMEAQGTPDAMPTQHAMRLAGRTDLLHAIKRHGGPRAVAERIGVEPSNRRKSYGYWRNFANLEAEIRAYAAAHGTPTMMPTQEDLQANGRSDMVNAIRRNGGFYEIADRLGLQRTRPIHPLNYWNDFAVVERELRIYLDEIGQPDLIPSYPELIEAQRFDLKYAIERHGGLACVAQKLGLRMRGPAEYRAARAE